MSLLAPLYLLGLGLIGLPVVFHLIRRTPSGRIPFSSTMFLSASPPRITKRSRLDQIALLCLRALAIILLAIAFARPFLRTETQVDVAAGGAPRVALLVDTSASMRRAGVQDAVRREVEAVLEREPANARLSLTTFDRTAVDRVSLGSAGGAGESAAALVRASLDSIAPTWAAGELGTALVDLADRLHAEGIEPGSKAKLVLVSDLSEGADLGALESYDWPQGLELELRSVRATSGNASLHPVPREPARSDGTDVLWARLSNTDDATNDRFELRWASAEGPSADGDAPPSVFCPPGESRVVRVPDRPDKPELDRVVLTGDGVPFDNTLFVATSSSVAVVVPSISARADGVAGASESERDPDFYLETVFGNLPDLDVTVERVSATEDVTLDVALQPFVVFELAAGPAPTDATVDALLAHVRAGGVVLVVLAEGSEERADTLRRMLVEPALELGESEPRGLRHFALLGEIGFEHPLFAPFSDPRYSDFTKVHFWHHRQLDLPDESALRVLARFDDGAPFLVERADGLGRLFVATTSWLPRDSDFARSSKFAPLLAGLLRLGTEIDLSSESSHVGDPVSVPRSSGVRRVRLPDGTWSALEPHVSSFLDTHTPGHYALDLAGRQHGFSVLIDPAESRTSPLDVDRLARLGVSIAAGERVAEQLEGKRQEQYTELERRQKLWRWLIVVALMLLLAETVWAGSLARRSEVPAG